MNEVLYLQQQDFPKKESVISRNLGSDKGTNIWGQIKQGFEISYTKKGRYMESDSKQQWEERYSGDEQYEDDEESQLKEAMTLKKRTYRLEIRKKKLQMIFNKVRKPCVAVENLSQDILNEMKQKKENVDEQVENVQEMYVQNKQLLLNVENKQQEAQIYDRIVNLASELNGLIYNFTEEKSERLENVVNTILIEFLRVEIAENIQNFLRQVFIHQSMLQVVKNSKTSLACKNTALWCIINMSYSSQDAFDVMGKLVDNDLIQVLKTLLKDISYAPLYENVMWLAVNLALDQVKYRHMLLEEGFILFISNFIKHVSEKQITIIWNCHSKGWNKSTSIESYSKFLHSHAHYSPKNGKFISKSIGFIQNEYFPKIIVQVTIFHEKFIIVEQIMGICLKTNLPGFFTLCLNGMQCLFQEQNLLSEWKFNILYQTRFFQSFFMQCTQNEEDSEQIACLYKQISLLDYKFIKVMILQIIYIVQERKMIQLCSNKIVSNFSYPNYKQFLVQQDMCMAIYLLLDHPLKQVRQDMMFSLSNFFSNGEQFVKVGNQLMLDVKVLVVLEKECLEIQKEAVWALASLLQGQSLVQKEEFLANKDTIGIVCGFFNAHHHQLDDELIEKVLESLICILEFGEYSTKKDDAYENNPYWIAIECHDTVKVLEYIIQNSNESNAQKAQHIIEHYSWSKYSHSNQ